MAIIDYYTPPSQEVFDDIKQAAIKLWQTYDDTYKYASGKIAQIKDIGNVSDNYAYMVAMFDLKNQIKLSGLVERDETRKLIYDLIRYCA